MARVTLAGVFLLSVLVLVMVLPDKGNQLVIGVNPLHESGSSNVGSAPILRMGSGITSPSGAVIVKQLSTPTQYPARHSLPAHSQAALGSESAGKRELAVISSLDSFEAKTTFPTTSFDGLQFGSNGVHMDNYEPPDVQIGVSSDYVVEMVNLLGEVWTKQGVSLSTFSLSSFYGAVINSSDSLSDPRVVFDAGSGRWFATLLDEDSSSVLLAVSQSSDPTGNWGFYRFPAHNSYCPDQPILGYSSVHVTISVNNYLNGCSGQFIEAEYMLLNKSELVALASVNWHTFYSPSEFSVHPVESLASTTVQYMVCSTCAPNSIELFTVTGVPPQTPTVQTVTLPVGMMTRPPNATQFGSQKTLDTGDNRVLGAAYDQDKIWLAFSDGCYPQGDATLRSCMRLVQLNPTTQAVVQDIEIGDKGIYYLYPALTVDNKGNLVILAGFSSSLNYPSLMLTGQISGARNSIENSTLLKAGTGPITCNTSNCRYGDYFGAAVDPSDPGTVWVAGEYGKATGWGTYIASVQTSTYNQALVTMAYAVRGGGSSFSPPTLSYVSNGVPRTATLTGTPTTYFMDSGTAWSVTNPLSGSTPSERWQSNQQNRGIANTGTSVSFIYYHQYNIPLAYAVVGDGTGYQGPMVQLTVFGNSLSYAASGTRWADSGGSYVLTNPLPGSTFSERWWSPEAGGLVLTANGIPVAYYHQFLVTASYSLVGQSASASPPILHYVGGGSNFQASLTRANQELWADSASSWSVPNPLPGSTSSERWATQNDASSTISGALSIAPNYFHQYALSVSFSVVGGGTPPNLVFTFSVFGVTSSIQLATSEQIIWSDRATAYTLPSILNGSSAGEQWIASGATSGMVSNQMTISPNYQHQYYFAFQAVPPEGGQVLTSSGWYDSGMKVGLSVAVVVGWQFEGWTGYGSGSYSGPNSTETLAGDGPANQTATFYPGLEVTTVGSGSVSYSGATTTGSVQPGTIYTIYVPKGSTITVTANPYSFLYSFEQWTEALSGGTAHGDVTVNSPSTLTATFGYNYVSILGIIVVVAALGTGVYVFVRRRGYGAST